MRTVEGQISVISQTLISKFHFSGLLYWGALSTRGVDDISDASTSRGSKHVVVAHILFSII